MNEVKKSLDAVAGDMKKDKEELKQRVLSGRRKPKRRNPFPLIATAIVTAAVLFFTFNVFQDGLSTADKDDYEVNEFIYDYQLQLMQNDGNDSPELEKDVLQGLLHVDAIIDYAKSVGYSEDMEAIEEKVEEEKEMFYSTMDNEQQEAIQEEVFGITYEDYFNKILKWTFQNAEAVAWLEQHPQNDIKTHSEVIDLFQKKHEQSITDFMDKKGIPFFDPAFTYEELAGTVLAKEGQDILVAERLEITPVPALTAEELLDAGYAAWYTINDNIDAIEPNMKIKLTYNSLSYPITEIDHATVFQRVVEWELSDAIVQPTLSEEQGLFYLHGLTLGDSQSDVIERFGEKYTKDEQVDGSGAEFALDYNNNARFYFYQDELSMISFENVDQNYFEQLFKEYEGMKSTSNDSRYIYSEETAQMIKAEFIPDGSLTISLFIAWPDGFLDYQEFLDAMKE